MQVNIFEAKNRLSQLIKAVHSVSGVSPVFRALWRAGHPTRGLPRGGGVTGPLRPAHARCAAPFLRAISSLRWAVDQRRAFQPRFRRTRPQRAGCRLL